MKRIISDTKHPVKIWASSLEEQAEAQLRNLGNLPFIHKHVAVMPDAHAGKGSTIGTVLATKGAIIPAAAGVDLGCGMSAISLPFSVNDIKDLPQLRHQLERSVPTGRYYNKTVTDSMSDKFALLGSFSNTANEKLRDREKTAAAFQLGTLGGGNHFIEICSDEYQNAWIMLHSGSRGIGNKLASIHIDKAKDLMKSYFINLPDPDLSYLVQGTKEFQEYMHDLNWAQNFAKANRDEMMDRVLLDVLYHMGMADKFKEVKESSFRVDCHHNYTTTENHYGQNVLVTRKGAVSAREGQYGIIPGSMGTKSYIVKGLGNPESFCSCSHGAGRRMSRNAARKNFTIEDLKRQTEGVECSKSNWVLDEIPGAYKDIDEVMNNQSDLVIPVNELKQILCVKGE